MNHASKTLAWVFGLLLAGSFTVVTSSASETIEEPQDRKEWVSHSQSELYLVSISPEPGDIPIGEMHRWMVKVTTMDGEPVYPAQIAIGGGMEGHGHGLPTQPKVIAYGGDGLYLVDGVRFNMEGEWRLSVVVASDYGRDRVDFDILLEF